MQHSHRDGALGWGEDAEWKLCPVLDMLLLNVAYEEPRVELSGK